MYMVQQDIDQLMRHGLEQDRLEGLVEILRSTSEILEAEGCILWVQVPSVKEVDPSLFTLAHSFGSEQPYASHNVSMVHSVAGQVIYSDEAHVVRNLTASEYPYDQSRSLKNERIQSFISVPIDFKHQLSSTLAI